ncbi:nuclear transport factor 2 family protein [Pseudonocardia spinosispora]|uniref:nuclear transport factor 2 family protein n=1 Tax=Pseudonocardia spinosispora TaxID=103441 RepID=UPI00041B731D|nr:nuclear transport factor 2 family protein [Pseudonocardia spinosispora]
MLQRLARREYLRGLRALERGDLDALLAQFDGRCQFEFTGDSPLGAQLSGSVELRRWFERFLRLLPEPRFDVRRVVSAGPPWRQQLTAHVVIHSSIAGAPYENQFAHFLVLRWGKVVHDLVIEDTQRWARGCERLVASGVAEAAEGRMTSASVGASR